MTKYKIILFDGSYSLCQDFVVTIVDTIDFLFASCKMNLLGYFYNLPFPVKKGVAPTVCCYALRGGFTDSKYLFI